MELKNDKLLTNMTEEEKEQEQEALLAQFGEGLWIWSRWQKHGGKVRPSHLNSTLYIYYVKL